MKNRKLLEVFRWLMFIVSVLALAMFITAIASNSNMIMSLNKYLTMFGLPLLSAVTFYWSNRAKRRLIISK